MKVLIIRKKGRRNDFEARARLIELKRAAEKQAAFFDAVAERLGKMIAANYWTVDDLRSVDRLELRCKQAGQFFLDRWEKWYSAEKDRKTK